MLAKDPTDCDQVEIWLHLVLDGECGPEERSLVETHLASCERCASRFTLLQRTQAGLRKAAEEHAPAAPASLLARIEADVAAAAHPPSRRWLGLAAAAALLVALGAAGFLTLGTDPTPGDLAQGDARASETTVAPTAPPVDALVVDAVARHVLEVPVDVASPDRARVERYLRPRVGEPVRVPSLEPVGLGLKGGRVVFIEGHRAAQLVYHSGLGRRVSVIAIPDHDGALTKRVVVHDAVWMGERGGYHVGALRLGPTLYAVVGDPTANVVNSVTKHLSLEGAHAPSRAHHAR